MKTLIIYAHPPVAGHCSEILSQVRKNFDEQKVEYDFIDLYQEKYDPVLYEYELYTAGAKSMSQQSIGYQEKIKSADKIVLIYPTWWNGVPAMLKGFFDKVLTSGFAFKFEKSMPKPLLKGKKAILFTSIGSKRIILKLFLGDRGLKVVKHDTLGFCGIKAKVVVIDGANKFTDSQKLKIEKSVVNALKNF